MKKKELKLISYNTGISMLRLFMSFIVVKDHFAVNGDTVLQVMANWFGALAVPCFMFVSFYLVSEKLDELNPEFLKRRFLRLELPIILWAGIYYLIYSLFSKLSKTYATGWGGGGNI